MSPQALNHFQQQMKNFCGIYSRCWIFFLIIFYCYTKIFQPNCIFHITIFFATCCCCCWYGLNPMAINSLVKPIQHFDSIHFTHDVVSVTIKSLCIRISDWKIAVTVNGRKYNDLPNIVCIWMRGNYFSSSEIATKIIWT